MAIKTGFKLDYLLPILSSAPTSLRWLLIAWLVLSVWAGGWIFMIWYKQEAQKIGVERSRANVEISRLTDDFTNFLQNATERHGKRIDEIAAEMNLKGLYSSGPHLKLQYEQVRTAQRDITEKWVAFKRNVEDVLMKNGQIKITDLQLKKRYELVEQKKDATVAQLRYLTDDYFARRKTTFASVDIKAAAESVLATH